jgi:hypothetical protein
LLAYLATYLSPTLLPRFTLLQNTPCCCSANRGLQLGHAAVAAEVTGDCDEQPCAAAAVLLLAHLELRLVACCMLADEVLDVRQATAQHADTMIMWLYAFMLLQAERQADNPKTNNKINL